MQETAKFAFQQVESNFVDPDRRFVSSQERPTLNAEDWVVLDPSGVPFYRSLRIEHNFQAAKKLDSPGIARLI